MPVCWWVSIYVCKLSFAVRIISMLSTPLFLRLSRILATPASCSRVRSWTLITMVFRMVFSPCLYGILWGFLDSSHWPKAFWWLLIAPRFECVYVCMEPCMDWFRMYSQLTPSIPRIGSRSTATPTRIKMFLKLNGWINEFSLQRTLISKVAYRAALTSPEYKVEVECLFF